MRLILFFLLNIALSVTSHAKSSTKAEFFKDIAQDYKNAYSFTRITQYTALLVAGAISANTDADENIRKWYQNNIRSSTTDNLFKPINNSVGPHFLYGVIGATAISSLIPGDNILWKYTSNSLRALLIALPQQGLTAGLITGYRPSKNIPEGSHWQFKGLNSDSRSVSGHATGFSIPFFTAANMSSNIFAKIFFNILALAPAVARMNNESHYFSQVLIGTGLGFLAARSVAKTNKKREAESNNKIISFAPAILPNGGYGLAFHIAF